MRIIFGLILHCADKGFKNLRHTWEADWGPCEEPDKKHLSVLHLKHHGELFGFRLPLMDLNVTATQVGPGLVYLTWDSAFGKGVFMQSLTPTDPLMQNLSHAIFCEWKVPTIVAKFYLWGEASQVERDVMVWNNKMFQKNPVLCKGDTLIKKHRTWYSQFYSEHSPTYAEVTAKSMEW